MAHHIRGSGTHMAITSGGVAHTWQSPQGEWHTHGTSHQGEWHTHGNHIRGSGTHMAHHIRGSGTHMAHHIRGSGTHMAHHIRGSGTHMAHHIRGSGTLTLNCFANSDKGIPFLCPFSILCTALVNSSDT